ncbi:unnamed protein product [Microthlaspi erraticum]|uniref:Reverse transcriptase domain-containing protein n=1 Tax=Microthlaspi erraticum TaxID=1685480 RepID=A0A6D2ISV5_9BRAS|nr:unnamed protein product [Microthlaspi erraticum]
MGVTGPAMHVLWNGEKTEAFTPSRGLRQGDPLSPYLFVLCMERLCHLIEESIAGRQWKPISLSRGEPQLSHILFADDLILFAEASVAQIRIIRRVLEKFCMASGQKVSLEKSKIYFSANVPRELRDSISGESGIQQTCDLGKYLGMPVLQKRLNKETFGEVIARVSSRMAGWKGRTLSTAGRLTLTKAVLSSVPVHSMSTILLPKATLSKLDQLSRNFLWGSSDGKQKQHLVDWKRVCRPKCEGGLGIRQSSDTNKAMISKVGWRLLQDQTSLWARVLRSKYKVGSASDRSWTASKNHWSSTWKSILVGMKEVILESHGWVVGDGRSTHFWTDRWLTEKPLLERTIASLPATQATPLVRDLWQNNGGWRWDQITPFVSEEVKLELCSVVVDTVTGAEDRLAWWPSPNGEFTVKSAYASLTRDESPRQSMDTFFSRVWKVAAPERVSFFLWLTGNQCIMTNQKRKRRHLSDSDICTVCKGGVETLIHILRDCPAMSGIWSRIVPIRRQQDFFDRSILSWLYDNLGEDGLVEGSPWSTMFAIGVWWGWKWCCGNVFGENRKCRDRVRFIKDQSKEVTQAIEKCNAQNIKPARVDRMIAWVPPEVGWIKLNTDGASRGNPGPATAGGALRNNYGDWCGGFVLNIGRCTAPLAELWGVYYGLLIAWEKHIPRLEVEIDSELVVGFLKTGINDSHPLSFLVRLCHGLIEKDWLVRISHVYREANCLADGLANYAFSLPMGFSSFDSVPSDLNGVLQDDILGSARLRSVCIV